MDADQAAIASRVGSARLLEREDDLRELTGAVAAAEAGAGQVAVVEAAAGMGKTALLGSAAEAAGGSTLVLEATGSQLERDVAFGVVRQLFERLVRAASPSRLKSLFGGAARLGAMALGVDLAGEPTQVETGTDPSFAALHGLYWLTANLSELSPLLLLVDDAHWADRSSARFLTYLSHRVHELPVTMIVALRPKEPDADPELVFDLTSQPLVKVVKPAALSVKAVAELTRSSLGSSAADEFCDACHGATRGNPFLVRELLKALEADEVTPTAKNAVRLSTFGPETVSRAVLARLARLPEHVRRVGHATAMLGADAYVRHLAALAELDETTAARAADALVDVEILTGSRPFEFVHPLVRKVVYDSIPPGERSVAHGRAARLLDAEGAPLGRIAAQLLVAEPRADAWAVEALRAAATEARSRASTDIAVGYLRRALGEPTDPSLRAELLRELGEAELQLGDVSRALAHLRESEAEAESLGERGELALLLAQAELATGDPRKSLATAERGLALVDGVDRELELHLKAQICTSAQIASEDAQTAADRVRRFTEGIDGTTPAERLLLATLALSQARLDAPGDLAADIAEQAFAGGRLISEQGPDAPATYWAMYVLIESDRFDAARELLDQAVDAARSGGSALGFATASSFRARLELCQGRLAAAETAAEQAIEVIRLHGWELGFPVPFAELASTLIERGELDQAEQALLGSGASDELPENMFFDRLLWSRAQLEMARRRPAEALERLTKMRERYDRRGVLQPPGPQCLGGIALALSALGEREEARGFAARQLARARVFATPRPLCIALRTAGIVEGGKKGIDRLREAVEIAEWSGARLELAHCLYELGAAHRRAGRRVEAREPLRRALDLAGDCGAWALADKARDELVTAGARPRRERISGVDALTARERRVAEMAGRGMTNREIAQTLFVTMKTVAAHLTHVYQKLDISSRDELSATLNLDAERSLSPRNPSG
jgi:DNA-binding CsgD family transcriptional regulator